MDSTVSDEERSKAIEYCRSFLPGVWSNISDGDVTIFRLRGGLSNLLYRCKLNEDVALNLDKDEKAEALLRIYGATFSQTENQVKVFKKLAEEHLGPKLLAEFPGGRFEEYLPSNPLTLSQMTQDNLSAVIAKKFACIHKLDLASCLDPESNWLLKFLDDLLVSLDHIKSKPPNFDEMRYSTKVIAQNLLNDIDFNEEVAFTKNIVKIANGSMVFSHNDLHQNNILLLTDERNQVMSDDDSAIVKHQKSLNERIVLIDFELSSYNYRTFDLGNHLSEWCFDYSGHEYPYFNVSKNRFPTQEKQREFLRYYVQQLILDKEFDKANGIQSKPMNFLLNDRIELMVDKLYDEMQPQIMASNLLWSMWAIKSACTSRIDFGYWEMAKAKLDIYLMRKNQYTSMPKSKY